MSFFSNGSFQKKIAAHRPPTSGYTWVFPTLDDQGFVEFRLGTDPTFHAWDGTWDGTWIPIRNKFSNVYSIVGLYIYMAYGIFSIVIV